MTRNIASVRAINLAPEFDTSNLKKKGKYALEVMIDYRWVRLPWSNPKARKNLDAAVTAAKAVVAKFNPGAERIPTAVRIVRVGVIFGTTIEATPEVDVTPCYVEIYVKGGNPDFSPAGSGPDPIPWGQQGWLAVTTVHDAYSPATLVREAERLLGHDAVLATRISRKICGHPMMVWASEPC